MRPLKHLRLASLPLALCLTLSATAAETTMQHHNDVDSPDHAAMHAAMHGGTAAPEAGTAAASVPTEPGQSLFAAIAEIVALAEQDPSVSLEQLHIDELREHLLDMKLVFENSRTETRRGNDWIEFNITAAGNSRAAAAIQAMSNAHPAMMLSSRGWHYEVRNTAEGATLRLVDLTAKDLSQLSALGFYGYMASDAHHQAHHWAIALGQNPHSTMEHAH